MAKINNLVCASSLLTWDNMYLIYILIAVGVLLFILILSLILGAKKKVVFMVGEEEIARAKYKRNQTIIIPSEVSNYKWFTNKELTTKFTQEKMKSKSITVYGKMAEAKIEVESEKETFSEKEIIDENKKSIKVKVGSLYHKYIEKLNKLTDQQKADYVELKNEVLAYTELQHSITKDGDSFKFKNKTRVKITILNGMIKLFVDMDKDKIDGRFRRFDESKFKKYSSVPLEFTIDQPVEVRKAKNTISRLAKGLNLEKQEVVNRTFEKLTLQ